MLETQGSERWKELLGVGKGPIRWGCALAFLVATVVSAYQISILQIVVSQSLQMEVIVAGLRRVMFLAPLGATVFTVSVVVGFRFLGKWTAAALVPAAIVIFTLGANWLLWAGREKGAELVWWALACYLSAGFCLLGILLALRWIKSAWVALAIGCGAGNLWAYVVAPLGLEILRHDSAFLDFRQEIMTILSVLFGAIVWAGLFYAGREVALADRGRISKRFYVSSVVGANLIAALASEVLLAVRGIGLGILVLISAVVSIYSAVVFLVWLHKIWAAIQDGHARTSPGRAVAFLFIPAFNIYWAFQVFWGFAKDYNRYRERHALPGPKLTAGMFLTFTVLSFLGALPIPLLRIVLWEGNSILAAVMIAQSCDAINALPAADRI